ncbi:hypothetical protein [Bacillus infantis]|uniref:hypothetical protein n=1 Tax=Bacillus infantis TaxID=324767 RepID=UPI003CF7DB16
MVPRTPRIKKYKRKHLKILKITSVWLAASSILFGGATLATPTYGEFNHSSEQEIDIQACFIFPQTILEFLELSKQYTEENKAGISNVLNASNELGIDLMNEQLSEVENSPSEPETGGGSLGGSVTGDTSTIKGLQDLISSYNAQISFLNSSIEMNKQRANTITSLITEAEKLTISIKELLEGSFAEQKQTSEERMVKIEEWLTIIISSKEKAIEECKYTEEFFENIIFEMKELTSVNNDLYEQLENEETKIEQQSLDFTSRIENLKATLKSIDEQNLKLAEEITSYEGQIASAMQQIQVLIEEEKRKLAEKEAKEKAEKEAKEKAEKEAKEKAEKEAKENAEKEAKENAEKAAEEQVEEGDKEKDNAAQGQPEQESKQPSKEKQLENEAVKAESVEKKY